MNSAKSNRESSRLAFFGRVPLLIAGALLLSGCPSLETMNQVQKEWDAKHPPGTGVQFVGAPKMIKVLVTYEATQRQRQAALEAGRRAVAAQKEKERVAAAAAAKKRKSSGSKPRPAAKSEAKLANVIAVTVPADERKQGKETIMLYDRRSGGLVGNEVYDISSRPEKREVAVYGGYTAEYVGSGVL